MPAHMAKRERRNRGAFLLIALGIGLVAFALVDPDPGSEVGVHTGARRPASTAPTVLGAVVTQPPPAPPAGAAAPATFDLPAPRARSIPSSRPARGPSTSSSTTSSTPPPTLGPPWSIESTTTTVDGTTTSTEAPTTSTEPPPTTGTTASTSTTTTTV